MRIGFRTIQISFKSALHAFVSNRSGVAALEFALILPVMLLLYLGGFEASKALDASRKVETTAETVGNLVARNRVMNQTAIDNIFNISSAVMAPFSPDGLQIVVTTVTVDEKGQGTIDWSQASSGTALTAGAPYPVPSKLDFGATSYLVVADVTYDYQPLLDYTKSFSGIKIKKSYTFRPRISKSIVWTN
ncbi:MAG TPA: TadE/TadG family type IV pilus assembly protein [Aurantimonas sp.]|uniref:Pilus assembly protein n=1 Tax=Aurantimonas marianensis TaxID=2920428 RepID=A0A9X2KE36_9HYPH|nr:TadE/TadG family type IV pilus assembly protein [Aurantimonas marianensis]MCP3055013.1 pilus assembly protein [Aurantimonas marianensis]